MLNRIEIKQMEEEQLLRYFSICYPAFPKAKIENTESPDFILQLNRHHSIGLELTRLFVQKGRDGVHFMPRFEKEKTELIERVKEKFERELPFRLNAHFDFSDEYYEVDLDLGLLSLEVFDYLKNRLSSRTPSEIFFTKLKSDELPHWLNSIDIMHHPENRISDWVYCKVDVPTDNFLTSIEQSIAHKEEKLSLYRKRRMDNYWLLIVAECLSCAIPFNVNNLLERWQFKSSFHKIFLMDLFKQKIFELRSSPFYNS
jgi:hypothetical protein